MSVEAKLSSRERVNRMFARQDHDRVPRYETFWGETLERWMGEGLDAANTGEASEKVLGLLQADMKSLCWYWPHPKGVVEEIVEEDEETKTLRDGSGGITRVWKHKSGTPQHVGFDCDSREKWEKEYRPSFLRQPENIDLDAIRKNYQKARQDDLWSFTAGVDCFEALRKILGDEEFMIQIMEDPEWIADIAQVTTDAALRFHQAVLDAGIQPDGLWIYDDMAFKNMTFCSPDAYRELIWPHHKRMVDFAHQNNMKFIFHSDGDLRRVMDLYVEAGFDCLQPLETKASMDVRELAPQYGDKLAFFGNIDVMKLLTNDLDLIEEEIRSKFSVAMKTRGYIYHSDHSVPPQVSWDTYQAIIRLVDTYGRYDA